MLIECLYSFILEYAVKAQFADVVFSKAAKNDGRLIFPVFSIETAVLHSLKNMARPDDRALFQIGDGARNLEDAVVGARRHAELVKCVSQHLLCFFVNNAEPRQLGGVDGCVVQGIAALKAFALDLTCGVDAPFDVRRGFGGYFAAQLIKPDARHLHMDVEAIQQGARNALKIAAYFLRCAGALVYAVAKKTTGAWIHRRNEHHPAGISAGLTRPRDSDFRVLGRLAQYLEHGARKFGQLVQKELHPDGSHRNRRRPNPAP